MRAHALALTVLLLVALAILLVPTSTRGASYWIQAYSCNTSPTTMAIGTEPVSWDGRIEDCLEPGLWMDYDGSSGPGILRSKILTKDENLTPDQLGSTFGGLYAGMDFDDFVIQGPGASVQTSVALHVSALLSAECADWSATAGLEIDVYLYLHSFTGVASVEDGSDPAEPYDFGLLENELVAVPGGYAIDAMIHTPMVDIPVNTTFSLGIVLRTSGTAYSPGGLAETLSDAGNTLNFPRNLPVFDLPAGYTVNSVGAGITDNRWKADVPVRESSWGVLKSRY